MGLSLWRELLLTSVWYLHMDWRHDTAHYSQFSIAQSLREHITIEIAYLGCTNKCIPGLFQYCRDSNILCIHTVTIFLNVIVSFFILFTCNVYNQPLQKEMMKRYVICITRRWNQQKIIANFNWEFCHCFQIQTNYLTDTYCYSISQCWEKKKILKVIVKLWPKID